LSVTIDTSPRALKTHLRKWKEDKLGQVTLPVRVRAAPKYPSIRLYRSKGPRGSVQYVEETDGGLTVWATFPLQVLTDWLVKEGF